ncbi:MAG: hypothetical protein IJX12_04415, partial [Lachnospiraceae bacterium]|nr:hypothetical protein [Lachnospiraceae bacterium]
MGKFEDLRDTYEAFYYRGYNIDIEDNICKVRYDFEIPGLAKFNPTWQFPVMREYREDILDRLVFSLGMVESISYYKCTCPKKVVVECGSLSKEQKLWWKKLFYNG